MTWPLYTASGGMTDAFLKTARHFTKLAMHGASMTQAFGVNDRDQVVGADHRNRLRREDVRVHLDPPHGLQDGQ